MALRINTNVAGLNAHENLVKTERAMNSSMAKLSSGYRINNAGDDAAGLVVADRLRATIRADMVSLQTLTTDKAALAIQEGDANTIESILERMAELAAKNDASGPSSAEWDSLVDTMDAIGYTGLDSAALSVGSYTSDVTVVTDAIDTVTTELGDLGAQMNALDFQFDNLNTRITNENASQSAVRDVDMAAEMVTFTKTQIMLQAGTAMLAQANTSSQTILTLLR